jgi:hypothetical protein
MSETNKETGALETGFEIEMTGEIWMRSSYSPSDKVRGNQYDDKIYFLDCISDPGAFVWFLG